MVDRPPRPDTDGKDQYWWKFWSRDTEQLYRLYLFKKTHSCAVSFSWLSTRSLKDLNIKINNCQILYFFLIQNNHWPSMGSFKLLQTNWVYQFRRLDILDDTNKKRTCLSL